MNALPIRRLVVCVLGIVIFFTIIALAFNQWAFARGLWLALLWQGASVTLLVVCGRLLRASPSRRRAWQLAGVGLLKFPVLYGAGYLALRAWSPSAWGLAVGLTLPWLCVTLAAIVTVITTAVAPTAARSA